MCVGLSGSYLVLKGVVVSHVFAQLTDAGVDSMVGWLVGWCLGSAC